jgi:hypothetical protein
MASDVLTLFNMPSSREIGMNYLDSQSISPAQMGNQGLLQQVVSMGGTAGAGIGYAGGRLFGGMAPQEARARGIEEAMAKVQGMGLKDDAEMYSALAQELGARGLSQDAMQAAQAARKVQAAQSQLTLEAARTAKENALAEKALRDDKLPSYGAEREAIAAELFNKTFKDLTPTERAAVNKRADTAAASNRQVIVMGEGTPKLSDLNPTVSQVRSELKPFASAYETAAGGIKLLDSGSPKAEAQVDRALATLSGDKQLSQAEVMSVVSAGTLPQRVVDSASKFFAGTSGKQSIQEKRDVLEAFAAAAAAKHNAEQAKLGRIYGTSQLSKDQVSAVIGEPIKFTAQSVVRKPLTTKSGVKYEIIPD